MNKKPIEHYYSRNDIARLLSVHPHTVWNWIKRGDLDSIKLPTGDLRVPESSLRKLISHSES